MFTNPQFACNVQTIREGMFWCSACGTPSRDASWKMCCGNCYREKMEGHGKEWKYCGRCGTEKTLKEFAGFCSKECMLSEGRCTECKVFHPKHYHS